MPALGKQMTELNFLSAGEMAEGVRAGRFSPVELVDAHIARIEQLNPKLNAFVHLDFESARAHAKKAEAAIAARGKGVAIGPLHGVPSPSRAR